MIKKQGISNSSEVKVTFVLPGNQPYGTISVVGDFNEWNPGKNKLVKRSNNTYSSSVTLPKGRKYYFRYLTAGGEWVNDEAADGYESSGFGSDNCVLLT